jgi:heterotetrameric sarcosine oxidase delta subunit
MIRIDCPNCGPRNALEFRYGGEYNPRPSQPLSVSDDEWADYIYMRDNRLGIQTEWWYHRAGCGTWFLAERHTKTNEIIRTTFWRPKETSQPGD